MIVLRYPVCSDTTTLCQIMHPVPLLHALFQS